jgi:hypothetical protein
MPRLPFLRTWLLGAASSLLATAVHGAVSIDIDAAQLRQAPGAADIRARIDAMLPAATQFHLYLTQTLFGFDPRRDITRIAVTLGDDGSVHAWIDGIPATTITKLLAHKGGGVALPGNQIGYPIPKHESLLLVALGDHSALITTRKDHEAKSLPGVPAASGAAIALHLSAPPHGTLPVFSDLRSLDLTSDGAGHITVHAQATDTAMAAELERRFTVWRQMVALGANGQLPSMIDVQSVLVSALEARSGDTLSLACTIPAPLRSRLIEHALERLKAHVARHASSE